MALLAAVSLHLRDSEAVHPETGQRVADLLELERLDDGHHDLHGCPRCVRRARRTGVVSEPGSSASASNLTETRGVPVSLRIGGRTGPARLTDAAHFLGRCLACG